MPPSVLMDLVQDVDLGSTPLPDSADSPLTLDFLPDTLTLFRSRLFGLVEIEDASGQLTTFIRYSEVDIFDYFPALNEIAIPDDLIGLCPLREDMLLAFSETKVYRITPSGTEFEWVKIADVGLSNPRLVVATNESVTFGNIFGIHVFDGSVVNMLPASNDVLSLIRTAVANQGTLNIAPSLQKVFLSLHEGATNTVLIIDTFVRAISSLKSSGNLTCISDIEGVSYFGFTNALRKRVDSYSSVSTLKSKRFASNDLDRIQLYYMSVRHLVGVGSLSIKFTFSTGKEVIKTVPVDVGTVGEILQSQFEIYGEGEWFEFEITHEAAANFTILGYTIGALPIDLDFTEGE
jgi:hypothetical protein